MRRVSRELLTKEELMTFTDAQLVEAKEILEKEIDKIKKSQPAKTLVINNDVGSRKTPEQFRELDLRPHLHNLALVDEAIKNRKSIIDFLNAPDPDLDESEQGPHQA